MVSRAKKEKGVEIKKVNCWPGPGCASECGLLVSVKDDKIVGMEGNPEHPNNMGAVCRERFPHLIKWLEHREQLMYPLKRVGERGEGRWERVTWDQALDEIAAKLKKLKEKYGPETLAVTEGTYRSDMYGIRSRFLNLFGNPSNVCDSGTSCGCNKAAYDIAVAGNLIPFRARTQGGSRTPRCFVYCGSDLPDSRPVPWRQLQQRLQEKPKPNLIVIDPRQTELADNADMWLQIRPGTDTALFMAWLNVIIKEGLYDKAFVDKWTFGFEDLKQRAMEYPPEKVAEITWIPADKIRESARMFAKEQPSHITVGLAGDQIGRNTMRVEQARICLLAITGNIKVEHGTMPSGPGPLIDGKMGIRDAILQLEEKLPPEQRKKQIGSDRFKLMTWPAYEITSKLYKETYGIPQSMCGHNLSAPQPMIWRAIITRKPYPITAMITWTSNTLLNACNTKVVYKALKNPNLELHVVLEHFMTPTAMIADYVLPVASKFERGVLSTVEDLAPAFIIGAKAVEPMGERRNDFQFFRELGIRLGQEEYWPWKTEEELYDYRLEPLGMNFKDTAREKTHVNSTEPWTYETINPRTGKPTGFVTPSGKLELSSNVLKELGYDPLPFYEEPPESPISTPEVAKEYPLIMNTGGRFMPQFQSEHRQLGMGLREQYPDPKMDIHPDTARELGIADGDWVYIETRRGVIKQRAKVTKRIHPKVVNVQHNWWFPEQPAREPWLGGMWESNCNVLTMDDPGTLDPLSGSWPVRALLCKVYKVETAQLAEITPYRVDREKCVADSQPYCQAACPLHVDVRGYVGLISEGKFDESLALIKETLPFPEIIGRICNHPCEIVCKRAEVEEPIAIRALKRSATDYGKVAEDYTIDDEKAGKVAIVGGGPAGLIAAYDLRKKGYQVTIFEALPMLGGMMAVGVPTFRLPEDVLTNELGMMEKLGVEVKLNTKVGTDIKLADLRKAYDAVFLAVGAQNSLKLNVPGEDASGVMGGLAFLRDISLGKKVPVGKNVVVIGGGGAATDVAMTALRQGAEAVRMVCLEGSHKEMPALDDEIRQTEEEGVEIDTGWGPVRIITSGGKVTGVELKRCTSCYDKRGKFSPCYNEKETKNIDADMVITAIGQQPDLPFMEGEAAATVAGGWLKADSLTLATNMKGVFAGGEVVSGPSTAIGAMAEGRKAATSIDRYFKGEPLDIGREGEGPQVSKLVLEPYGCVKEPRRSMPTLPVAERRSSFREVELGLSREEAIKEAARCLSCQCWLCRDWIGCPAIQEDGGKCKIDITQCLGCGVCSLVCPQEALKPWAKPGQDEGV